MKQDYMMTRPSVPADIPRTSGAEIVKAALAGENLLAKGDVAGHEFHGNQYSDGGGRTPDEHITAAVEADARGNTVSANYHRQAADYKRQSAVSAKNGATGSAEYFANKGREMEGMASRARVEFTLDTAHKAASAATAASAKANKTGKSSDHRAAAATHMDASRLFRQSTLDHGELGNRSAAAEYSRLSEHHWDKAQEHTARANG